MTTKSSRATINDVARIAGVSKKTVSRVINKSPQVREDTYRKVEKVIAELNYLPDPQARGLSFRRSFLFGLVFSSGNPSFIADIQDGVLDKARKEGFDLVVHPCDFQASDLLEDIQHFVRRLKLAGIILLPPLADNDAIAEMLRSEGCHYVRVLSAPRDNPANMVQSNDRDAVARVADHLIDLGHQNIAFIKGPDFSVAAQVRYTAFKDALARRNVKLLEQNIASGDHRFASGLTCTEMLLANNPRPTAIFASNDEMALGAIVAAIRNGIKIPEQLSIVGFDDVPHAAEIFPPLTTVNHNLRRMGQIAAEKLTALCSDHPDQAAAITTSIELSLVCRESTGPAQDHA